MSPVADDPRVRRQGDAFASAGWDVVAVGIAGATSVSPQWHVDEAAPALNWSVTSRVRRLRSGPQEGARLRGMLNRFWADFAYLFDLQASRLSTRAALRAYWDQNFRYHALYEAASRHRPDVWLANDWNVLPIAQRLAKEQGVPFLYDSHELAFDEYGEKWVWRLLYRPLVVALEKRGIRGAAFVTCVSEGIAECLRRQYGLERLPLVVRNTPAYQTMPFRETGEQINVLYHGVVSPGRGLEECIRSVALWRPEFRLIIRGPASDSYERELRQLALAMAVSERVSIVPPVPMPSLIAAAHSADVGLFALPASSRHNTFVLPNKFFEYAMAGLALCVSDLPEMARLVKRYDLGLLISDVSADAIATQINALDRGLIDCYKRRALAAARQLSWEEESKKLLAHCAALVTGRS
nr:glycosyltransferase [Microvirga puerhi]